MTNKDSADFIKRTNEEYAAWCKTYYTPEALDERGMPILHGLWAWQEQERRNLAKTSMFSVGVAERKWIGLQNDGYKMQHITFVRDSRVGTIDSWGKVMWLDAVPE